MFGRKFDLESSGWQERLEDISHDVDLYLFVSLDFLPNNWIVKEMELFCLELAQCLQRLTLIDQIDVSFWRHCYIARWLFYKQ